MSLVLGCIADDYTGASDLANTLTQNGLRTVQTIGIPADSLVLDDVDAVVIALKIRSVPAAQAAGAALVAEAWLRRRGARHVMYKICSTFDSTDDGNIGHVLEALHRGGECVVVTPAFPQTGRTVYQGHLFVNGVPLHESPLKDHPLNPMRDSDLARVLARQTSLGVGRVNWHLMQGGTQDVALLLCELARQGKAAAICDALSEDDLEMLGQIAAGQAFSIGASGLGLGLARALRAAPVAEAGGKDITAGIGGYAACIAGSCSQATLQQIAAAERTMPVLRLDPAALVEGRGVDEALGWARERLVAGPLLISSSTTPEQVASVQARFGREAASHAIEQAMASIAEGLALLGVRRLVVAGGETSGAAVDRLGIAAFLLGPEIAAGVPLLRSMGDEPMLMALKSGNFGGETFFADALRMMGVRAA